MEVELRLLRKRVESLTCEKEILEEKYLQLKSIIQPNLILPTQWGFSSFESKILSMFLSGNGIFIKDHYHTLYLDKDNCPDKKLMDVWACKIRKKIKDNNLPIVIETLHSVGYKMDKTGLNFLSKYIIYPDIIYNSAKL